MKNIIPVKSIDINIVPFDNGGFLITHQKLNHRLNVNQSVFNLLNLVDGKRTLDEICKIFLITFKQQIKIDSAYYILFKKLGKYHIIENNEFAYEPVGKADYLKLSTTILKKKWISPITEVLSHLYSPSLFYPLLILSFMFVFFVGAYHYNYAVEGIKQFNLLNLVILIPISLIILIFHEFGHAAASKFYGANHGNVGFGFYLLSPVMYANVSDIWKLKRKERIVVNLGGIYIQIIITSISGIIFLFTRQIEFLIILYFWGIISIIINLNPFLRTDGYWILSDIIGISNLRKKSNILLLDFMYWILKKKKLNFNKENLFLILYSIISTSFIFVFIGIILWNDSLAIFSFPMNFFSFIKEFTENNTFNTKTLKKLILPLIFYILVIRFSIKGFKTFLVSRSITSIRGLINFLLK